MGAPLCNESSGGLASDPPKSSDAVEVETSSSSVLLPGVFTEEGGGFCVRLHAPRQNSYVYADALDLPQCTCIQFLCKL
jgi:hypothetical protein